MKKKKLANELYFIFCSCFIIVIFFFVFAVSLISDHIFRRQAVSYNNQMLGILSEQIDSAIAQVSRLSFFAYQNETIHKITSDDTDLIQKVHLSSVLEQEFNMWQSFLNYDCITHQAYFIHENEILMSIPWNALDEMDYQKTAWYQAAKDAKGRLIFYSPESIPELPASGAGSDSFHFIALRRIYDIYHKQSSGVLILDISISHIDTMMEHMNLNPQTQIYIMNPSGDCLFSVNATEDPKLFLDPDSADQTSLIKGRHSRYLWNHFSSDESQWEYVILTDYRALMQPLWQVILLISVIACFLLIVSFFQSRRVVRRVIREVTDLMDLAYTRQIREKEAKLHALQSQINPHFLYNTLGTIGAMATIRDVPEITAMTNALSDLFRYTITQKNNFVTLRQECENLDNYIRIQTIRYGERLVFRFKIPAELYPCKILCFTLQPLVENAIIHGIESRVEGGSVVVCAKKDQQMLILEISDNGVGILPETLEELNRALTRTDAEDQGRSLGLGNVARRLSLVYGSNASMHIFSTLGEGTTVRMTIPCTWEESG